jgi:biopolymer transport protein ExbD
MGPRLTGYVHNQQKQEGAIMIRCAAIITAAVLVLQGCQTSQRAATPAVHKTLTVQVTADQLFVCNGARLSVEEFFEQADYAEGSDNVILDVAQESKVAEATIVKAIDFLKGRGYTVAMSKSSKYQHLIP